MPEPARSELAERLLKIIRRQEFLRAGDRVAVAVSGGADSVALLLLLLELRSELGITLSVAHVNHKLRGAESDEDERFVAQLAATHGLELATRSAPVARAHGTGIEGAARELRYRFFRELACGDRAAKVATAHTLDDQAETVLLRLFRGTGIRGLAGILPRLRFENEGRDCGEVVRPLLGFRRAELRDYLRECGQAWREDSSNANVAFLRNRLRQRLMPLIVEQFGEAAIEHLADLAEIARAEEEHWRTHTDGSALARSSTLSAKELNALPLAAARRSVRAWLEKNAPETGISFRLIEDILDLARGPAGKKLELPGTALVADSVSRLSRITCAREVAAPAIVRRSRKELVLESSATQVGDYEYALPVPGEVFVRELGVRIAAEKIDVASVAEENCSELLAPDLLDAKVAIRNWRAGDRYWPANSRQEKKVKELLSARHAAGREKKLWPVAVCRGELVWVRGFAAPRAWQARSGTAIRIREMSEPGRMS